MLLLRQKVQDDSVESFRVFHIWHMPNARHHNPTGVGHTLLEALRNGMTIWDISLPNNDERWHPDGIKPLRGWRGKLMERIRIDLKPSRILRNDLDQAGSHRGVFQRWIEERAIEPDFPPCLDTRFFGPHTDCVLECGEL